MFNKIKNLITRKLAKEPSKKSKNQFDVPTLSRRNANQITARSSVNVNNGITNVSIPIECVKLAFQFWTHNISELNVASKTIISAEMFDIRNMPNVIKKHLITVLDKMEWILHQLLQDNADLVTILRNLGNTCVDMGFTLKHFNALLASIHDTLESHFQQRYTIQVKCAVDRVVCEILKTMTGKYIDSTIRCFRFGWLESLETCLESPIGRNYLFAFLKQRYFEEFAVYLGLVCKFENSTDTQIRFEIASDIWDACIKNNSEFTIAPALSTNTYSNITALFASRKVVFLWGNDVFAETTAEVREFIRLRHWNRFVNTVENLRL